MTGFWMEVSHAVTGNRLRNPSVLCLCCTIEFWQLCEVDLTGLRCGNLNCQEWNHVKLHVDSHFFVHFAYFKWPDLAQFTMKNYPWDVSTRRPSCGVGGWRTTGPSQRQKEAMHGFFHVFFICVKFLTEV